MKKYVAICIGLIFMITAPSLFAASSVTQALDQADNIYTLTLTWTAHTDGTFTTANITYRIDGKILKIVTNPGATAPTADYDITILDSDGCDVLGGGGIDRHTSSSEIAYPSDGTSNIFTGVPVTGGLQLAIANNSVASAGGTIKILFER